MPSSTVKLKNSLSKIANIFTKNISLGFWLAFGFVLIFEFFVISKALKPIINPDPIPEVKKAQGIRYNFSDYDEVVKNIQQNKNHSPEVKQLKNPFLPPL